MINHCVHVQVLVPISIVKYWLPFDCVMKAYKKFIPSIVYFIFSCFFVHFIPVQKLHLAKKIPILFALCLTEQLRSLSCCFHGVYLIVGPPASVHLTTVSLKSPGRKEHLCPLHLSLFIPCAFAMNADICKWNDKMLCAYLLGPGPVWQCSVRRITRLSDSGS